MKEQSRTRQSTSAGEQTPAIFRVLRDTCLAVGDYCGWLAHRCAARGRKHPYRSAFLLGALMYIICVIPFLIYHDGIFFYYGDYNVQQVPFYIMAHRAVREGRLFWSPYVDLGGSMGGSFAFYLWGSPFSWLTIPFPESWLPYMMPFLMALKYGTAAMTGSAWIRTLVKTDRAALIGGLLYAFSGFQACNIVFQHFHDVVAFFPLYLLAFELFLRKKRRLPFALMTTFMVILNYYFFVGEVAFLILYYFVRRVWAGDFGRTTAKSVLREIGSLLLYGMLGLGIAAFFLVQSLEGVVGNTRVSNWINGYDWLYYSQAGTPLAILKSFFVVPDLIAKGTLFTSDTIKSGSVAAYLPCFGVSGAVAYSACHREKKNWQKVLMAILFLGAFFPLFNSIFSAFNTAYYARWFYLPVLLMAAMTAQSLEEANTGAWKKGAEAAIFGLMFFALCGLVPTQTDDGWTILSMQENPQIFWVEILGTALTVPFLILILFGREIMGRGEEKYPARNRATARSLVFTAVCCMICTMAVLLNGNSLIAKTGGTKWRWEMLESNPSLPDTETFARSETDGTSTNYEMVWGYPTIHCFESTVTPSIQEFYEGIGVSRSVESELPWSRVGARQILSVRYEIENLIISSDEKYSARGGLPGYTKTDGGNQYYDVYENQHFIPMGFTFDHYVTESEYGALDVTSAASDRLLVHDLILKDEDAARLGLELGTDSGEDAEKIRSETVQSGDAPVFPTLVHDDLTSEGTISIEEMEQESDERAATSCTEFAFDNGGFTAVTSDLPKQNLVFFSVPWSSGWTAYVDGEKADIVRADFGFMAVVVPEGVHEISFRYLPYGFRAAVCCSLVCASIAVLMALRERKGRRCIR